MSAPTTALDRATSALVSVRPVVLPAPGRGTDLHVRVSAPVTGTGLPVVVLSHGFGGSMDDYAPLVDYWAARGLVVVQPTHLDSRTLGLAPSDPRYPDIWRTRVDDLRRTIDELDRWVAAVPGLDGRVDAGRIALAGHSWGGQSAGMLLGARVLGADGAPGPSAKDERVTAGVLLSTTGTGEDLTPFAAENFPFMRPAFEEMTTPTLVVAGDRDQSLLSTRGPDWFTDPYVRGGGPKSLLTVFGGEHTLGGVHGYGAADTTDENPQRVALVREVTWAYLQHALGVDDRPWDDVREGLATAAQPLGRIESR